MSEVKTYAVNCNDAWLNTDGDDISGSYVKYADYIALATKLDLAERACAELAAENAGLKSVIPQLRDIDADNDNMDDVSLTEDFGFNHAIEQIRRRITETPATDAFLAEVRAQGGAKALVSLEQNALSGNSTIIPGEVFSAILKVARVRADFDDFDGDRRGIGDCLDEAEQELIVTINKHASQLAAGPIAPNDVREQTAIPPVPVMHTDVAQAIEKLKRKLVECNRYNYCADAVKGVEDACRAAMLQRSEPVTDTTNQQFESLAKSE